MKEYLVCRSCKLTSGCLDIDHEVLVFCHSCKRKGTEYCHEKDFIDTGNKVRYVNNCRKCFINKINIIFLARREQENE